MFDVSVPTKKVEKLFIFSEIRGFLRTFCYFLENPNFLRENTGKSLKIFILRQGVKRLLIPRVFIGNLG